jgi:hypothetical protein
VIGAIEAGPRTGRDARAGARTAALRELPIGGSSSAVAVAMSHSQHSRSPVLTVAARAKQHARNLAG